MLWTLCTLIFNLWLSDTFLLMGSVLNCTFFTYFLLIGFWNLAWLLAFVAYGIFILGRRLWNHSTLILILFVNWLSLTFLFYLMTLFRLCFNILLTMLTMLTMLTWLLFWFFYFRVLAEFLFFEFLFSYIIFRFWLYLNFFPLNRLIRFSKSFSINSDFRWNWWQWAFLLLLGNMRLLFMFCGIFFGDILWLMLWWWRLFY